jgi:exoribonuclease R
LLNLNPKVSSLALLLDFRSRSREKRIMDDLLSNNVGGGFCHSWYSRRFLSPVLVDETPRPHSGLGLECYSQWTSPIRRFGDLQVHCAIKRFLRRNKVIGIYERGEIVPSGVTALDLGLNSSLTEESFRKALASAEEIDQDIDYSERAAWLRAARPLQNMSKKYWMFENIRRLKEKEPDKTFDALVLGCTNPTRRQYAIYVFELGLEWRYNSPSSLQAGMRFRVQVGSVLPRNGQLSFVRIQL